jgi:ATP-dependent helicase Lhr and Lhr-like helicase
LGIAPPAGLPTAFLESVADPPVISYHVTLERTDRSTQPTWRSDSDWGLAVVQAILERLAASDRVVMGEFLPGRRGTEWCDVEVLRLLKRRSLAKLRKQIEPVATRSLGTFPSAMARN